MVQLTQIIVACSFHLIDFASGFIYALKLKQIKSSKMRDGLFKKMGFIFCYLVAILFDKYGALIGFEHSKAVLPIIVGYSVLTELVSIAENVAKINPKLASNKLLSIFNINTQSEVKENDKGVYKS